MTDSHGPLTPLVQVHSPTEERNPRSRDIDTLASAQVVERILAEDATVVAAVQALTHEIARLTDLCVEALTNGGRVHYVGAGTSGRLGVLDAVELLPTYNAGSDMFVAHLAGGDGAMMKAVEGAEDSEELGASVVADHAGEHDVIVGLAASGRTPYVKGALAAARERGLATALVSANPNAPLAALADVPLLVNTGPEVVTGSTRMKAATAQKVLLNALSTSVMVRLGKTFENLMIDVRATNEKLVARTVRIVREATGVSEEEARAALEATGHNLRAALVLVLAGAPLEQAPEALEVLAQFPPSAKRPGDASGIRSASDALRARVDSPTVAEGQ